MNNSYIERMHREGNYTIRMLIDEDACNYKKGDIIRMWKGPAEARIKQGHAELIKTDDELLEGIVWDKEVGTWASLKAKTRKAIKGSNNKFIYANVNKVIYGKPFEVQQTKATINLLNKYITKNNHIMYIFLGDKDYPNSEKLVSLRAFIYRVIYKKEEYYILSEEELPSDYLKFTGMEMPIGSTLILNSLKINADIKMFLLRKFENQEVIPLDELVKIFKKEKITPTDFEDMVFYHPSGYIYKRSKYYNLLRIAQILSGKYEGYPLHTFGFSIRGLGKTYELESLNERYGEEEGICEAGSGTLKGLVPSFKSNPLDPGYIIKCKNVALIDELCKMINKMLIVSNWGVDGVSEILGQLNFILEHKERNVLSGNCNSSKLKATAKLIIMGNPLIKKRKIEDHIAIMDSSTLSRIVLYAIDEEEKKYFLSAKRNRQKISKKLEYKVFRVHHLTTTQEVTTPSKHVLGTIVNNIFEKIVKSIKITENSADNATKKVHSTIWKILDKINKRIQTEHPIMFTIWEPRCEHHAMLLLDGIVKYRCLFKSYTTKFKPIKQDYIELENLLNRIVDSWSMDFEKSSCANCGVADANLQPVSGKWYCKSCINKLWK